MPVSLAAYRIATGEAPGSAAKNNNMLTAIERAFNAFPVSQVVGYPADSTKYLNGSGNWSVPVVTLAADLAYAQFTAPVTISSTNPAVPNVVVTASAVTFDGSTACWIEFFSPQVIFSDNTFVSLFLWQDGAQFTAMASPIAGSLANSAPSLPVLERVKVIPSSGSHVYSVRGYIAGGAVGCIYNAGAGGAGQFVPGYIRITK